MKKKLFIAWVPFQRRSQSMRDFFDYKLVFIKPSFKFRFLRPIEYILKTIQTVWLVIRLKPNVLWIQLPPNFILHITFLLKKLLFSNMKIVADCHNATFRSPWINIPGTIKFLDKCTIVLVHNTMILDQGLSLGIGKQRILVLEDPPANIKSLSLKDATVRNNSLIIFPCSFNADEPIQEIIDAAKLCPDISFILTGNPDRARGIHSLRDLPPNMELTGFLCESEFNNLLCKADVILGLTKLDGIQLSVANEAVGIGKPLILSDTPTLRRLFYRGVIFVDPTVPVSIAQGCQNALLKLDELSSEMRTLKAEKQIHWHSQATAVLKMLAN